MPSRSSLSSGSLCVFVRWSWICFRFALYSASRRRLDVPERVHKVCRAALVGQAGGPLLVEQQRDEVGAVGRQLEQRLVHQVHVQVAAPDVGDEHHLRLERRDVREVLLRPHAQIHAALPAAGQQVRNHPLQPDLVRDQVVGSEDAVRLGRVLAEPPEFLVGQPIRQRVGSLRAAWQRRPPRPAARAARATNQAENRAKRCDVCA